MMFFLFAVAAAVTIISAVKLSTYADVIGEKTRLGSLMAGTILLAGATSLPEVTTSVTAVVVGNPDLAVSNVFGSNLFNLFILALIDLIYRQKQILRAMDTQQIKTAWLSMVMTAWTATAVFWSGNLSFFGIGVELMILFSLYILGMAYVSKDQNSGLPTEEITDDYKAVSLSTAKKGFAAAALITLAAGSLLSISADGIAAATGIGSTFIGTFLLAGATSLPELVTVLVAVQLMNYRLALGNILGSNLFNLLILIIIDLAYLEGAVLEQVHPATLISAGAVIILHMIFILFVFIRNRKPQFFYAANAFLVVLFYVISSFVIFIWSS
ncbi:sodium:calcium antiporter [Alkalicoccus chagannorensis]|uniref:sodium:calcium antiporter n=1 Tax=Alkalicoccus chagannorensis TaxID=427072 RepID=UPI000402CD7C|nr:sodium:calcium antiporter [Alkalicoccus chagannorensis]